MVINWHSVFDAVNGGLEMCGGIAVLNHCRAVLRDKKVAGVSLISVLFFWSWGLWNMLYYPSLHQWFSTFGGALIFGANTWWLILLHRYWKPR